ncbi:DNA mismatch repair protein MutS [Rhodocyclus tenuis]|uniref:DNA mismatch repair protein MutS n=2 Tax=Rhodocyclus TaxID=1064 RepID=A0A6L5JZ84_RHOTE|nr:DNA mismatch repair protein MutS [Rhodocyclus gracilis]
MLNSGRAEAASPPATSMRACTWPTPPLPRPSLMSTPPPDDATDADDARQAWLDAIRDATPLLPPNRVSFEPPKPRPRPRQRELDERAVIREAMQTPLDSDEWFDAGSADAFLRNGVSRMTLRDLRRGRWAIQGHLDLHGYTRHEAQEEVERFIDSALGAGQRCIRIVHGRGLGSPGREGVLRTLVKSWLARRRDVLAFCHAPPRDGGEGALWILLRTQRNDSRSTAR